MSISRTLVDIFGVASATSKIGYSFLASQSSTLQHHVKTSSLLNPTPTIVQTNVDNHQDSSMIIEESINNNINDNTITTTNSHITNDNISTANNDNIIKQNTSIPLEKEENTASQQHNDPMLHISSTIQSDPILTTTTNTTLTEPIMEQQQQPIDISSTPPPHKNIIDQLQEQPALNSRKVLKEARIPTSRVGRLWHYGTLATGMGLGAINESLKRATGISKNNQGSVMLSEKNVDRLVEKLSTMRGAALKMGQMLSIQGIQSTNQSQNALPPQLEQVLLRVHDSANYMPKKQMEKVMEEELGKNWLSHFEHFDPIPIAAASIGQVHAATLLNGKQVVIKIQYPGVAQSIDSDLSNLKALVTFSNLLPKGLYLDNTIKVTKEELSWECDYLREAGNAERFGQLLKQDNRYKVPEVIHELCTKRVLVCERLYGQVLSKATEESQDIRNKLGENLLRLCLREVFSFRFMQTDPNWSNFFYNSSNGQIELLDFGACREYSTTFLSLYGHVLLSASRGDREGIWEYSKKLRFVTGYESDIMKKAHIDSVMVLGEPFMSSAPDAYDFSEQTITQRVRDTIPIMLQHRLTPPPDETYGLHKKISGAFLLCTKLGSRFNTKKVWKEEVESVFHS
ncbi:ABC1 family-domain-containing protein [Cunninghamella echinulata]|nr:ABC1 family-domain-containing protein [Cunninghamella echinulata]